MRDLKVLTASFTSPGVQLVLCDVPCLSHFGGSPNLPSGIQWPERKGKRLAFLARVSLSEMQRAERVAWLPSSGALLFFYDVDEQPWGFDPNDKGCCSVLHVPDLPRPASHASAPADDEFIARKCIDFCRVATLPSRGRDLIRQLEFNDEEFHEYLRLVDEPFLGMPKHQISGLPSPFQSDHMALECQLASNGLYCGDDSGHNDPRAKALAAGAKDWRLLFQFDSDDELRVMWGDCGMLYFWVRENEAALGNFQHPWLILQCS
ncbi:MAG: DUF1963 domain-containing protein [Gemmatimonadetes bacterium]|nr:DUF1963 domain-containing protein [Gemmatimonadota bacterium]